MTQVLGSGRGVLLQVLLQKYISLYVTCKKNTFFFSDLNCKIPLTPTVTAYITQFQTSSLPLPALFPSKVISHLLLTMNGYKERGVVIFFLKKVQLKHLQPPPPIHFHLPQLPTNVQGCLPLPFAPEFPWLIHTAQQTLMFRTL